MNEERAYYYDLYNIDTEKVEATEVITPTEAKVRNSQLRINKEPQRWIASKWINH